MVWFLDSNLEFRELIQNIFNKVSKTIELLNELQKILPMLTLITIYKSFTNPHLDYRDTMYNETYIVSFIKNWIPFSTTPH